MEIRTDQVPMDKYMLKCPYTMEPKYIVVHNTANDASAANEIAYMKRNDKSTSFHFAVDDKEAVQGIPVNRNAWHAGDGINGEGNRRGIAVEICYSKSGGEKFYKSENNAAELIAKLMSDYNIDIKNIKKHQDFDGKYCPHRTLDLGWDRFLQKVSQNLNNLYTGVDEIVGKLSKIGIIQDEPLWKEKLLHDENAYWLARKSLLYILKMRSD